jgi:hypothetical protein
VTEGSGRFNGGHPRLLQKKRPWVDGENVSGNPGGRPKVLGNYERIDGGALGTLPMRVTVLFAIVLTIAFATAGFVERQARITDRYQSDWAHWRFVRRSLCQSDQVPHFRSSCSDFGHLLDRTAGGGATAINADVVTPKQSIRGRPTR